MGIRNPHEKEQADSELQEVGMDSQQVNVLKMSHFTCFSFFQPLFLLTFY